MTRTTDTGTPSVFAQNSYQAAMSTVLFVAVVIGCAYPGALLGALLIGGVWRVTHAPMALRCLVATASAATALFLSSQVIAGWPWRLLLAAYVHPGSSLSAAAILRSVETEMLLGPAFLLLLWSTKLLHERTTLGRIAVERERTMRRSKALEPEWNAQTNQGTAAEEAPPDVAGKIRLGMDETQQPFDLDASEIAQHVFIPGASGTGKTTTLMRLAHGALANGYGIVIVDCKGVGLSADAKKLAAKFHVPFHVVDPDDKKTIGYDPCTGDASHVANKLIGAFTFSGEAEIYKQVAMEVVPIIVRALVAAKQPVTLDTICDALGKGGLAQLGRRSGAEKFRDRLEALEDAGGIGAAGYTGLARRLGALTQGKFGPVFEKRPALDWEAVTRKPSVTYLSLSTTAASEDVELFGRVITQDLKQFCDSRLRAIDKGKTVMPVVVMYDEFAALREARQIVDLLLQARQARMPVVIATQFLPEEIPIRTPALSAGVLICHRVAADDAEALSAEMGTRTVPKLTNQVDFETGESEKGSVRMVDEYNVHPNELRQLGVGVAAVYARPSGRRALVHIKRDQP